MSDGFYMILSDGYGRPTPAGAHRHWVRTSTNPHMTSVNQLTAGGAYPGDDCGEACGRSTMVDRGDNEPVIEIEHDADNAGKGGTTEQQIIDFLHSEGLEAHIGMPPLEYVMNPLGGILVDKSQTGPYAAASLYRGVVIDTPGPWDVQQAANIQPIGGTLAAEDDMFSDTDRAMLTAIADAVKEREGSGPYVAFEWNGQKHGFKVRDSGVVEHDWWDGQRWQDENLKNIDATGRVAVLASGADVDWEIRADNSLHIDVLDKTLGSWHWHADPGGTFGTPDHQ